MSIKKNHLTSDLIKNSKKIIASRNYLIDEKFRRSLFKETYDGHLNKKIQQNSNIDLAHALHVIGINDDLSMDEFLNMIKNIDDKNNIKKKQKSTWKV